MNKPGECVICKYTKFPDILPTRGQLLIVCYGSTNVNTVKNIISFLRTPNYSQLFNDRYPFEI